MLPSEIIAFDNEWKFNPNNEVTIYSDSVRIRAFDIYDDRERIEIDGLYSFIDNSEIEFNIQNLDLNKSNLFLENKVGGVVDGEINIFRKNYSEPFQFDGQFLVSEFTMNDFLVGNISGDSKWNPNERNIYSTIEIEREGFKSIKLNGYYSPLAEVNQLDMNLLFDKADIELLQPLLKEHVSDIHGYANGELKINGQLTNPNTIGECQLSDGRMKINYLNTSYSFSGPLSFDHGKIQFHDFTIIDRKGSYANVVGSLTHNFFNDIATDIVIDVHNFEFLNTTATENSLFYGSAIGTGNVQISGPLNDILIKATVKTDNNTRFFVPIEDDDEISQQDYIAFKNFQDTVQIAETEDYDFSGFRVDFDIEVTPEAYCELIFDIKTGDIIRGRGRGNIKLTLDTDGEFSMFGPLEITDGAYNFTVPGFINKEFNIVSGSTITWFGDPYNATIDMDASYLQRANFEPLRTEEDLDNGELSSRVGLNVLLDLQGPMLSPDIDFDLKIADQIDETPLRLSKLSQVSSNEQELKRQVISLLFFKRFSPISSFTLGGGGNVGNSVSEFFSNQVSYLVSQLDENLEVEVDLASLDNDAFNTFQLRLAYTFLDGRLKVTRGGDFVNEEGNNDGILDDIVGDWSVEYSLTRDGRLRAKVFRTTNRQITNADQNFETGVSLRFVHSFNEFKDLLTSSRKEALKRRESLKNKGAKSADASDSVY